MKNKYYLDCETAFLEAKERLEDRTEIELLRARTQDEARFYANALNAYAKLVGSKIDFVEAQNYAGYLVWARC